LRKAREPGVETKALKQAIKRNPEKFPGDFPFCVFKDNFQNPDISHPWSF
jgi:hypothetical protein